jgi:hypothetical protein
MARKAAIMRDVISLLTVSLAVPISGKQLDAAESLHREWT